MEIISRFGSRRTMAKATVCLVGGATAVALALSSASAIAATTTCALSDRECSFTISNNSIQKAPTLFKLQAQISQAKIPLVDATFSSLTVKIKSGNAELCTEKFTGIRVRNGVLNLEIGRNIQGCQLDDEVAKHNDLAFQVCIGDGGDAANCLKPIQISSVPYALKSNFASQSQEAYRAEVAARAHYAQRLTADGSMLEQSKIGSGYYDFQYADAARIGLLTAVNSAEAANVKGGFLQWTAVDPLDSVLNISAKNIISNYLEPLARFNVHATQSNLWGALDVLGHATIRSGLLVTGAGGNFTNGLRVLGGNLVSDGNAYFNETIRAAGLGTFVGGLTVSGGVVRVQTDAEFTNGIRVTGGLVSVATVAQFNNGIQVGGSVGSFANGITVNSGATFSDGLVNVATSAAFGVAGTSTTVSFSSGTTVDMSQANVMLPASTTAPTPDSIGSTNIQTNAIQNRHIGLTMTELTADSPTASDCAYGTAALTAKFCGITKIVHKSGAATPACTIIKYGLGYRLQACGATCAANCF